jgi:hypothetical protein
MICVDFRLIVVFVTALACARPAPEASPVSVDQQLFEEIQAASSQQVEHVWELAQRIGDPVVQRAAVSSWILDNGLSIEESQGGKLCQLLTGNDQIFCFRRLRSPHLRGSAVGKAAPN